MKLPQHIADIALNADGKALATFGEDGINVVPVSSIRIVEGNIWLVNYFMGKTLANILRNPIGALVCWKGYEGYQIRATIAYHTEGSAFSKAVQWIKQTLPERVVRGLLVLEPTAIFDISASRERAGVQIH